MTRDEVMCLEDQLCELISDSFDTMPDRGSCAWDVRKLELINKVIGLVGQIECTGEEE